MPRSGRGVPSLSLLAASRPSRVCLPLQLGLVEALLACVCENAVFVECSGRNQGIASLASVRCPYLHRLRRLLNPCD